MIVMPLLMIIYAAMLWRLGSFPVAKNVPIYLGGGFTPHGLKATRTRLLIFIPVLLFWLTVLLAMDIVPTMVEDYVWIKVVPWLGYVWAIYLMVSNLFLFTPPIPIEEMEAKWKESNKTTAFPLEDYPTCLVGAEDEAKIVALLENPRIVAVIKTTPFPPGIRELSTEYVEDARITIPSLWVQPLHPQIAPRIADQTRHLEQSAELQAEKSIEAIREVEENRAQMENMKIILKELQHANETLNNKLLSMRNRTRSTTGAEFTSMTIEQLVFEQEKLMFALRKVDEEKRRKKSNPEEASPEDQQEPK